MTSLLPGILAAAGLTAWRSIRRWLFHLGGIGLIPLGMLDNSVIPLPGSMDVMTIVLSSRDQRWWLYYILMATIGSVAGGFLTYRLARKGGKSALERRFSPRSTERICSLSQRWGFATIFVPALLPPPMPMVPFLLAAGAMQYDSRKFLTALTLGRALRYSILAYLGVHYGRQVITYVMNTTHPVFWIVAALLVSGAVLLPLLYPFIREIRRTKRAHA